MTKVARLRGLLLFTFFGAEGGSKNQVNKKRRLELSGHLRAFEALLIRKCRLEHWVNFNMCLLYAWLP